MRDLQGVHPALVRVVQETLRRSPLDFQVHDGLRPPAKQQALLQAGASRTPDSRHLTGHAVDLVPIIHGKLRWDWDASSRIAEVVKAVAAEQRQVITSGGDWKSFPDGQESAR